MVKPGEQLERRRAGRLEGHVVTVIVFLIGVGIVWIVGTLADVKQSVAILQAQIAAGVSSLTARQIDFETRVNDKLTDHEARIRFMERRK